MTEDIRLDVSWLIHRKRKKLENLLGPQGIVSFIDLMLSARQNRPDGKLVNMTNEDIALDANWSGDPDEFVKVLCEECKLLSKRDGYYELHNWEKRNPYSFHAKDRSEKARRAALIRHHGKDAMLNDAKRMPDAQKSNAPSPSPSPSPKDKERKEQKKEIDYSQLQKQTDNLCKTLSSFFKKFNFYAWRQQQINKQQHPEAIKECLSLLWKHRKSVHKGPRPYLTQLMKIKGPNAFEREVIVDHEKRKKEELSYDGHISGLFKRS